MRHERVDRRILLVVVPERKLVQVVSRHQGAITAKGAALPHHRKVMAKCDAATTGPPLRRLRNAFSGWQHPASRRSARSLTDGSSHLYEVRCTRYLVAT